MDRLSDPTAVARPFTSIFASAAVQPAIWRGVTAERNVIMRPLAALYTDHGSNPVKANQMRATLVLAALLAAAPIAAHAADSFLDRARNAVQQAGKDVQSAAKKAGRSVRDF